MLKLNIGASDAEVTPPGFGDLAYSGVLDTIGAGILLQGFSLRDIVSLTDNFLTYSQEYPVLDWNKLTLILRSINQSFLGPLTMVNQAPLVIGGVNPIDSATVLSPGGKTAVYDPMKFQPGTLDATPKSFALNQNYPNPFNPTTTMSFTLGEPSSVTLMVYNMLGQEVATLLPNIGMGSGEHSITFNGDNLASGVYFYKLTALRAGTNNVLYQEIKKMILMK